MLKQCSRLAFAVEVDAVNVIACFSNVQLFNCVFS